MLVRSAPGSSFRARLWLVSLLLLALTVKVESFLSILPHQPFSPPWSRRYRHTSDFKSVALNFSSRDATVNIVAVSACDEEAIFNAASFLVDSFWLGSPRQWVDATAGDVDVSETVRTSLVEEQAADLMETYGERMGKRMLNSCLVCATNSGGSPLGMVCLQVLVLDSTKGNTLNAEQSEDILKNAVASLGPKQRRLFKDASVHQISTELLPESQEAICCFSNLAVAPSARRQGIALQLCQELESVAKDWDFDSIFLKVESDNESALNLYKNRLGYVSVFDVEDDSAIRLDTCAGKFIETQVRTLLLKKAL